MKPFERLSIKQKDVVMHAFKFSAVYPNSAVANHHAAPLGRRTRYAALNIGRTIAALEASGWLQESDLHVFRFELTSEAKQVLEQIVQ